MAHGMKYGGGSGLGRLEKTGKKTAKKPAKKAPVKKRPVKKTGKTRKY